MSRKMFSVLSVLVIAAMLLAACGGGATNNAANNNGAANNDGAANNTADAGSNDAANNTANNVAEGGDAAAPAAQTGESILDRVIARGTLVCGGRTNLTGFGYLDADGNNVGFDIDLCRAVAAAVLGDPNAVEVVNLDASDRGPALQTAEVDLLSRNVTHTSSRNAQWGNFTITMFYDGQGFLVHNDSGITDYDGLNGSSICVGSGTTTEQNLADFLRQRGFEANTEIVTYTDADELYAAYENGRCDVTTSDISQLAAKRSGFADPTAYTILAGAISKEPLTPAVPHGDDAWFDVVNIVMMALINAEELGVTQANVEEMKSSDNINVLRLLGQEGDWGYSSSGLDPEALAAAISAVGNYGEIYDRYMGPDGDAFTLPRGLNDLWTEGGLIYAPPIK